MQLRTLGDDLRNQNRALCCCVLDLAVLDEESGEDLSFDDVVGCSRPSESSNINFDPDVLQDHEVTSFEIHAEER